MALKVGVKQLVAAANAKIRTLSVDEAKALLGKSEVQFIDIRDPRELERDGVIPGAFHAPRGMLEFWVDPESPYYKPLFGEDRSFVLFCAGGLRSALSTATLQEMGLPKVCHIAGGFGAWKQGGGEIVPYQPGSKG
ncbi:rhodanese-like domain-containing protein [Panacagrimonas sp.]|uniref:rhodanese-like domain-containing protein n=1 Tax=Panacagrimonas sp. TaxID=2480088 RepID=UPI003B51861C